MPISVVCFGRITELAQIQARKLDFVRPLRSNVYWGAKDATKSVSGRDTALQMMIAFVRMGIIPASCRKNGSQRRWLKARGES